MLTHFLGGICVGIAMLWFLSRKTLPLELNLKLVYQIVLGVLVVGVLWELYEIVVYNIIAQNPFIALDTFSDIFFDLAGGTFAVLYLFKKMDHHPLPPPCEGGVPEGRGGDFKELKV